MIETIFGVKITHLVAGVAGGTVRYLLAGGGIMMAVTSVLVGSLTAGYLTTPVYFALIRYFPDWADPSAEHAAGFLVGLTGLLICEGVMRYAKRWTENPTFPPKSTPSTPKAGE